MYHESVRITIMARVREPFVVMVRVRVGDSRYFSFMACLQRKTKPPWERTAALGADPLLENPVNEEWL